jgi:hypothetical protein
MIDSDIIEDLPSDIRREVRSALMTLVQFGVVQAQRERLRGNLLTGDANEPPKSVAKRVLDFRRRDQALESLEELGKQYLEEADHA